MEAYQTEEQQVEAIKKFWHDNGNSVIVGLLLGFAGFAGYGYYNEHKMAQEVAVADAYIANVEDNAKNAEQFNTSGEKFIAENGDSSYAALTALAMAKNASDKKDWAKAESYLSTAVAKASNAGMKAIAQLRLARVQLQLEQYEKAMATLGQPMPESFKASVEETKGDGYLLQGKKDLARAAYQAAIDAGGLTTSPALQMKVDDLTVALN